VWGPSSKLLAGDKALQAKIKTMLQDGVKIQACQACTDSYGVTEQLRAMEIEVKYMGKPLTFGIANFPVVLSQSWRLLPALRFPTSHDDGISHSRVTGYLQGSESSWV
jgi:hypothetical protein